MVCRLVMCELITGSKRSCGKVMFLEVSVILSRGHGFLAWVCMVSGGVHGWGTCMLWEVCMVAGGHVSRISRAGMHRTGMDSFYCLLTKLQEDNFFMTVCHSVHRGDASRGGKVPYGIYPPPTRRQTVNGRAHNRHPTGMHTCSKETYRCDTG